jgi:hypothetical protein
MVKEREGEYKVRKCGEIHGETVSTELAVESENYFHYFTDLSGDGNLSF